MSYKDGMAAINLEMPTREYFFTARKRTSKTKSSAVWTSAKKCPGFIMAVGNHIPANTPVDNALWYNECFEKMLKR